MKFTLALLAALLVQACALEHSPQPAALSGAAGSYNIAPGSPAHRDSTYPIEEPHRSVEAQAATQALTLNSSFTTINSENGAQIWRSNSSWDAVRCFVMSQGSSTPNNYWTMQLLGPPLTQTTGTKATHGTVSWIADLCGAQKCNLSRCVTGQACVTKGVMYWTTDQTTIFTSIAPLDGFAKVECRSNSGGTPGHPILKRWQ